MILSDHIQRVVKRSRNFFDAQTPGHYLINAIVPAETIPIQPLYDFNLETQLTDWLDYRLASARPGWRAKEGLDDDSIPSICPYFGIGEHSAWIGMEVKQQYDTCLPIPILDSPKDLVKLRLSEQSKWFQYMKKSYDYLRSKKDGSFVLAIRGTMSPMDVANAVRGDGLFLDFIENEEFVHRLLEYLVTAISWYFGHLRTWADEIEGGYVTYITAGWMGPNYFGHLSNDTAMLCATNVYRKFGLPYEMDLVRGYERVLYHVHNEKLHYAPDLAALPGLSLLEITDDPKTTPSIEDLPRILSSTRKVNLMLHATSDQVRKHINQLSERNVFFLTTCADRQDAEDIVRFVRDRSKPL